MSEIASGRRLISTTSGAVVHLVSTGQLNRIDDPTIGRSASRDGPRRRGLEHMRELSTRQLRLLWH